MMTPKQRKVASALLMSASVVTNQANAQNAAPVTIVGGAPSSPTNPPVIVDCAPSNSTLCNAILAPVPAGTNLIGNVGMLYPAGSTPISNSTTGTVSAVAATLAANATTHTYICGFSIRANAAAATTGNSTLANVPGGPLNFTQWTAPNASGIGLTEMIFQPCMISVSTNTTIVVTSAAASTSGVVSVAAWGFQGPN